MRSIFVSQLCRINNKNVIYHSLLCYTYSILPEVFLKNIFHKSKLRKPGSRQLCVNAQMIIFSSKIEQLGNS